MTWIAIDGEGIGRAPHRYVQLCRSDGAGDEDYLEDVRGLSTEAALGFLLRAAPRRQHRSGPQTRLCGFYLGYDWTKILSDLPDRSIYRLLRPELRARPSSEGGGWSPVRFRDYQLHYLAGMMQVRRGDDDRVTVWDLGRYYQCSFVVALEGAGIGAPETIKRMKGERGSWEERDLDRMRDYCLEECRLLVQLATLLERQHVALGVNVRSWFGPGSTADAVLSHYGVAEHIAAPPSDAADAADAAYFGGRFEHSAIGKREGVYSYDIRSAYPSATLTLPCLAHARWIHSRRAPRDGAIALVRYLVTDIGDRVWGPLPCRLDDGTIVWSRGAHEGWAWHTEWLAAREWWEGVEYGGEHWELRPGCRCQPFAFVSDLYAKRVSDPVNKQVYKLALNSLYGKTAQSIGQPKHASRSWAGIITSTCRARMLELVARHGDESNLIAIATDGAYSTEEHPETPGLGGWERKLEGSMCFLRPGIYWGAEKVRARGIGSRHMRTQIAAAESAIDEGRTGKLELGQTELFGGARECVYATPSGEIRRSLAYGEWVRVPVSLSLDPTPKRDEQWRPRRLDGVVSRAYSEAPESADAQLLQLLGSLFDARK